jgi:hypothetical protein
MNFDSMICLELVWIETVLEFIEDRSSLDNRSVFRQDVSLSNFSDMHSVVSKMKF